MMKIKKSIEAAWNRLIVKSAPATADSVYTVVLNMEPGANSWNRAAIELSEENRKVPSRRQKIAVYPVVTVKETFEGVRMSTNQWNDLALELREKHRKREEEKCAP